MKYGSYETKAEAKTAADKARKSHSGAIFFFSPSSNRWEVRVRTGSSTKKKGGKK
jgi:hypothetical protein